MVTATIRTVFAPPDGAAARVQLRTVADTLASKSPPSPSPSPTPSPRPRTTCSPSPLPKPHWRRIWSTNPLERVNKELKRRANVVGIFPDDAAVLRLLGAVLIEVHDEWQVGDRRYFSDESMKPLTTTQQEVTPAIPAA